MTKFGKEEALARVQIGDQWGYINPTGKFVIKPHFDDVRSFSEGLASVKNGGKYGFINPTGEVVIKPQFDDARFFSK